MIIDQWLFEFNDLLKTLLPDFVLSFAFFTSITYAALAKRLEHQRSAIAASAAIGFSLSTGLVWWEQANGLSIRNLGTIAVGFAIISIAFVMYSSIRKIGGSFAGAGITLGVCLIIAQLLGLTIPIDKEMIQSAMTVALIVGIFAFLIHTKLHHVNSPVSNSHKPVNIKPDMTRLFRDRHLSDDLSNKLKKLRKQTASLNEHPKDAENVLLQIKRILPEQGYLTERMTQLRTKAHRIRNGHIARLKETKHAFLKLPAQLKKQASQKLVAGYNQIVGIDTRLERLDVSVAETERRIKELLISAAKYSKQYDFQKLTDCLKKAQKLQKHNSHLFKIIEKTEMKLTRIAQKISKEAKQNEVNR